MSSGRYNFHIFQGVSPNTGGPKTDHTVNTAQGMDRLHLLYGLVK